MIRNLFRPLLVATGIAAAIGLVVRSSGSIVVALVTVIGFVTLPFRLVSSLIVGLSTGFTPREWAMIELSLWQDRRKSTLASRNDFISRAAPTARHGAYPPVMRDIVDRCNAGEIDSDTARQLLVTLAAASGPLSRDMFVLGAALAGHDLERPSYLSGRVIDDIRGGPAS